MIPALLRVVRTLIRVSVRHTRSNLLLLTAFDNLFYRIFRVAMFFLLLLFLLCARDPTEKICISVRRRPREASALTSATHCTLCLQSSEFNRSFADIFRFYNDKRTDCCPTCPELCKQQARLEITYRNGSLDCSSFTRDKECFFEGCPSKCKSAFQRGKCEKSANLFSIFFFYDRFCRIFKEKVI